MGKSSFLQQLVTAIHPRGGTCKSVNFLSFLYFTFLYILSYQSTFYSKDHLKTLGKITAKYQDKELKPRFGIESGALTKA